MTGRRFRLPALPPFVAISGLTRLLGTELTERNHLDTCATSPGTYAITSIGKSISKNGSNDELKARARPTSIHRPRESSATAPLPLLGDYDDTTMEQRGHNGIEPITSFEGHGEHPP